MTPSGDDLGEGDRLAADMPDREEVVDIELVDWI
jgi:hypothetical protein